VKNDYRILEYLSKKQCISQRELAAHTGLSLGNINLILKQMVKKGLIMVEQLKPNIFRYVLTPQGTSRKELQTYQYILDSVRHVLELKKQLEGIVEQYGGYGYTVFLYGDRDDIREFLEQLASEGLLRSIKWIECLEQLSDNSGRSIIVVWQAGKEEEMKMAGAEYVNLLDEMGRRR
jgi:DNA-binding MarR family transcriptional regulator